ncbi:MAG: FkbM family methyltransferase [Chlamydiales bacterium]|nr:FkbM family methyltransferase [Chlamydiales bacterium]
MPLPENWTPKYLGDLIRIGSVNDGGYILPERILKKTKFLISLGLADDWSFEKDFQKKSNAYVVCYDHTTTKNFWRKRFLLNCFRLILRKNKKKHLSSLFDYLRYRNFFNGKTALHHQKKIGYANQTETDLISIIQQAENYPIFLKIDIEGWEYRILTQISELKDRILGFVIEFHDVDILSYRISNFIENVKEHFTLVHIHANNCGGIDDKGNPIVLEMTWIRNDEIAPDEGSSLRTYPIEGLDQPNTLKFPDIALSFSAKP